MANITIFCPRTGSNVQVWVSKTEPGDHADAYEAATCPSCGRLHFVNKATGETLSGRTRPKSSVRQ